MNAIVAGPGGGVVHDEVAVTLYANTQTTVVSI